MLVSVEKKFDETISMMKRLTNVVEETRREMLTYIDSLEQRVTAIERYHNLSPKESPKLGGIIGMEQVHEALQKREDSHYLDEDEGF